MGNILKVGQMWIFVNPNEAKHERPHVHVARMRGPKGQSIKIWLDTLELASRHKSFSMTEVRKAMKTVIGAFDLCMDEWTACHGNPQKRG